MAKKKSWFSLVKRLFIWDTQSKQEKNGRRRKWIFGRLKIKRLPSITAPPPPSIESTQSGAEEEQSKHALTVPTASAASAAETANQCQEETEESELVKCRIRDCAAIKIQTAFRGYLAKKALRALKGIVKLQAIIRGRAVRRQAMNTLKCLQSIVDIQSQVCARRLQMVQGRSDYDENQEIPSSRDKIIRMDSNSERRRDESILLKEETDASFRSKKEVPVKRECVKECSFNHRMDSNSERRWDDSILLKEETDTSHTIKKEGTVKRERIKEYSFNHRRSAESERNKLNGRWRYWLEQWVDTQISKSKELEDLDSIFSSHGRTGEEYGGGRQLKLRTTHRQNQVEGSFYSPKFSPRKPFSHRRQGSLGDDHDHSISSSSVIPTYMAATESARAKARSPSSPKLRTGNLDLTKFGNNNSPCKKRLSLVSSINNEVQQRSPSLKGISGPVKSSRIKMKDLSVNSDGSLPNWDQQCAFKREIFK